MEPLIETLIFVKLIVYYVSILLKNMDGQLLSLMIKDLSSPLTLTHTSPDASWTRIVKDSGTRLCRIYLPGLFSLCSFCPKQLFPLST